MPNWLVNREFFWLLPFNLISSPNLIVGYVPINERTFWVVENGLRLTIELYHAIIFIQPMPASIIYCVTPCVGNQERTSHVDPIWCINAWQFHLVSCSTIRIKPNSVSSCQQPIWQCSALPSVCWNLITDATILWSLFLFLCLNLLIYMLIGDRRKGVTVEEIRRHLEYDRKP